MADPQSERTRWLSAQAERAALAQACLMLVALLVDLTRQRTEMVALAGLVGLGAYGAYLARYERPSSWLPTVVTGLRILLTVAMVWLGPLAMLTLGAPWGGVCIAGAAFTVFTLDGLDGWLARRSNSVSELGGRLDGEADAFLMLSVCLLHLMRGLGPWVLVGGLLRYVYILVVHFVPSRGEVPRHPIARYVFGMSITSFMLGFLPLGRAGAVPPMLATALLCWSFGRSFYWSFKKPEPQRGSP